MLAVGSIGLFPTHSSEYTYVTDLEGSIVWNWSCEGVGAEAVNFAIFIFVILWSSFDIYASCPINPVLSSSVTGLSPNHMLRKAR